MNVDHATPTPHFPRRRILVGDAVLAMSDGRTATSRAAATGYRHLVLFDLALDFATCKRLALAPSDGCSDAGFRSAVGLVQSAGIAVSRIDDVAGLVVLRTVATLANEAADAVTHGIATARDVDVAMRKGVNYPRGPLAWADDVGAWQIREVLHHLAAQYGQERYRISPLIARRCAMGQRLSEPSDQARM